MTPTLHVLTVEQLLQKFIDEGWEQKLSGFHCSITPSGDHKTIKRWHDGPLTICCIRERQYSPSNTVLLVCLLRDENDLYSYDESYFTL
jgi:hypothetical protein